jgi:two-component system cell cycle sensor histidine kinase/response regulator CckA
MHALLARQIRTCFESEAGIPPNVHAFVASVQRTYEVADSDRRSLERALEITSQEFVELSDQLRAELAEHGRLQSQLLHSQKMEAVGRLAGGIAHDFNNLLTVILGYCEMAAGRLGPADPSTPDLEQVRKAGHRAAALTRRLLAFSRREVVEPRPVSLNELLLEMNPMLRRVIGTGIELATIVPDNVGFMNVDPDQFDHVVLNLVVNARDAMPSGGTLTLATSRSELGRGELDARRLDVEPGTYVTLAVSDTGHGIPEEVRAHLFEPYFTTKPKDRGTGLGLATCWGLIRQAGGTIEVESTPGGGTTFRILVPAVAAPAGLEGRTAEGDGYPAGTETVLLVEDEAAVRRFASTILSECGYRVIEASHGDEAIAVAARRSPPIDLLVTDIVMPRISGREVIDRVAALRPGIRVLAMSGYLDEEVLDTALPFLEKPFTAAQLACRVRDVLDRSDVAPACRSERRDGSALQSGLMHG